MVEQWSSKSYAWVRFLLPLLLKFKNLKNFKYLKKNNKTLSLINFYKKSNKFFLKKNTYKNKINFNKNISKNKINLTFIKKLKLQNTILNTNFLYGFFFLLRENFSFSKRKNYLEIIPFVDNFKIIFKKFINKFFIFNFFNYFNFFNK